MSSENNQVGAIPPQSDEVTITGTVRSVLFRNEANGWSVLTVTTDEGERKVTGPFPFLREGMSATFTGRYEKNRFGIQINASSAVEILPTDDEGIEKYLASGLIRNIGPVFAKVIVGTFGDRTLEVLDNEPERLLQIPGIGKKRVESIVAALKEQKEVRNIMIWLKRHDLSNTLAAKIYQTYGDDSVKMLEENPYRLADDIRGIGFRKADEVALKMGIPRDSPFRIRSGVLAYLAERAVEGHTCYPKAVVTVKAAEDGWLGVRQDLVKEVLEDTGFKGITVTETEDVFLTPMYRAEDRIAACISRVLDSVPGGEGPDIEALEAKTGFSYSDGQKDAIRAACSSGFSVITGGPGTGKTSVTNAIIMELEKRGLRVVLAAPTGRAARRMAEVTRHPSKTIHRLLEAGRDGFQRNEENKIEGDVLIVDETSMIDTALMRSLLVAVPDGMRVILVGDIDQLPSIGAGCVLRDIIDSGEVPVTRLNQIFRQAMGSQITTNAHRINAGMMPVIKNDVFHGDMFFFAKDGKEDVSATVVRLATTGITRKFGYQTEDIQVLSPMRREGDQIATLELNKQMQAILNPHGKALARKGDVEFREGDRVMQVRNDYDKGVFNGESGVVVAAQPIPSEDKKAVLAVDFDGNVVRYPQADLKDLELSYACTVHKSQGMEYPVVVMPVHDSHYVMLKRNLLYTGITRARKLCVLVGTKRAIELAVNREDTARRITRLKERIAEKRREKTLKKFDTLTEGLKEGLEGQDGKKAVRDSRIGDMLSEYGVPDDVVSALSAGRPATLKGEIFRSRQIPGAEAGMKVAVDMQLAVDARGVVCVCKRRGVVPMPFEQAMEQGCFKPKTKPLGRPRKKSVEKEPSQGPKL